MNHTTTDTTFSPQAQAGIHAAPGNDGSDQGRRLHPLMAGAAAAVILVSLLGTAAITGLLPSSRSMPAPAAGEAPYAALVNPQAALQNPAPPAAAPTRYMTADGQVLEVVRPVNGSAVVPVTQVAPQAAAKPVQSRPVQHRVVHYTAQNSAPAYQERYEAPRYVAPAHPVRDYVSDMHPVGTGVGAVVGGLLGNQVGGGNGRKAATVAGVLLGGYAGNEVAHDRNPLSW